MSARSPTAPASPLCTQLLDAASRSWVHSGEAGAVGLLADICQQRFSTPTRLFAGLESLPRLAGRAFIGALLGDVATGALSLLEHRYLTRVERAHGLPRARRQGPFRTASAPTVTSTVDHRHLAPRMFR